ncbi:MAG: InlB B-repeat-containing protein [Defluviitaleaceae bacterium]|nr:InlB B-repeat-containing protein [Defluviitaleaceae bacterium]
MKTRRVAVMFVLAIAFVAIVAIPIWASVGQDSNEEYPTGHSREISYIRDGVTIIGNDSPVITFSVYGYGTVRASDSILGQLTNGSTVDPGAVVTFTAEGTGDVGFEFLGWRVNGLPYRGLISQSLTLYVEEDVHVMATFDHPWAAENTPPPSNYIHIPSINAIADSVGTMSIRIPGHTPNVEYEYFTTSTTVEYRITPPAGRYFNSSTSLNTSQNMNVTHGPTIMADGRLAFTMLAFDSSEVANVTEDGYSEANFAVVFYPNYGTMPSGVNPVQSLAYGHVINPLPTPTRTGYRFLGWQIDGLFVAPPLTVTRDLALRAIWTTQHEGYGQFAVGFNPAPGSFTDSNETGIRVGNAGDLITNMPGNPTRTGYTFGGWRLPNGNTLSGQMTIVGDALLTAIWNPAPGASSSPTPSPSSSSTPAPSSSSTPAPSGQTGHRPNPQTNPLRISFMIFGVMAMAGTAIFGITKLARKQLDAQGQYQADVTRFNRESRIVDIMENEDQSNT